jgi:hypothetical protein
LCQDVPFGGSHMSRYLDELLTALAGVPVTTFGTDAPRYTLWQACWTDGPTVETMRRLVASLDDEVVGTEREGVEYARHASPLGYAAALLAHVTARPEDRDRLDDRGLCWAIFDDIDYPERGGDAVLDRAELMLATAHGDPALCGGLLAGLGTGWLDLVEELRGPIADPPAADADPPDPVGRRRRRRSAVLPLAVVATGVGAYTVLTRGADPPAVLLLLAVAWTGLGTLGSLRPAGSHRLRAVLRRAGPHRRTVVRAGRDPVEPLGPIE